LSLDAYPLCFDNSLSVRYKLANGLENLKYCLYHCGPYVFCFASFIGMRRALSKNDNTKVLEGLLALFLAIEFWKDVMFTLF
tara:strand:+ start:1097 stop:1342 length:246 start_codon:yes stop_codon:yes gene_type:complete